MKHYIYSDPHFNHERIIKYVERPFDTIEEMNEYLIEEYNKVVTEYDKVYILGDFGFGRKEDVASIVKRLNGYKVLILGNHDRMHGRNWWIDVGFDEVHKDPILIRKKFLLSHEPLEFITPSSFINLHGHTHDSGDISDYHLNMCVEKTGYRPMLIQNIEKWVGVRGKKRGSQR